MSAGSGELVPTAFPEKRKRLGPSHKVMVALKNNMIYDLALAPNVEVEFSQGTQSEPVLRYRQTLPAVPSPASVFRQ